MGICDIDLRDLWVIEHAFLEYEMILDKERENIKKHIDAGHTGSSLDPRDYQREWEVNIAQKKKVSELLNRLKECAKHGNSGP